MPHSHDKHYWNNNKHAPLSSTLARPVTQGLHHEQVNALIKSDGGAVGLTESPQALELWMVAGYEIARVLLEFEASFSTPSDSTTGKLHEQSDCT